MTDEELDEHIARLRRQGSDDALVEVKTSKDTLPTDVWQSVSAFSNTAGGCLILGVSESEGFTPVAGFKSQRIIDQIDAGLDARPGATPKVLPVPEHRVFRMQVDASPVVVVEIDSLRGVQGVEMPCHVVSQGIQKGSFKRVDDKDKHLTTYEVYLLQNAIRPIGTDREPVNGTGPGDLSPSLVSQTLERQRRMSSHALDGVGDDNQGLERLNILTRQGIPTLAGYLTLGTYPQRELPQLVIDVTVHQGVEKSRDDSPRFLDRRICDGALPWAIEDAVHAVVRNLRTRRVVRGTKGEDIPEIPESVLREAITNAVAHRDYSEYVRGQQVSVDVYADRVEVISPGGFWGDRTAENVFEGRSSSRNEVLSKILTIVPSADSRGTVSENQGSGVARMVHAMRDNGLPVPDYSHSDIDHVTVVLGRFGLVEPDTRAWLDDLTGGPWSSLEESALALARRDSRVDVTTLRTALGVDSDDARQALSSLTAASLLKGSGDGPYVLDSPDSRGAGLTAGQRRIVDMLDLVHPLTAREIAEGTGRSVQSVRPILRDLVERGAVVATAPPTSRRRAYLAAPGTR